MFYITFYNNIYVSYLLIVDCTFWIISDIQSLFLETKYGLALRHKETTKSGTDVWLLLFIRLMLSICKTRTQKLKLFISALINNSIFWSKSAQCDELECLRKPKLYNFPAYFMYQLSHFQDLCLQSLNLDLHGLSSG